MLIRDSLAELLFGDNEVLVAARDLVNDHSVRPVEGDTVTYAELILQTNRAANALLGLGLKAGDRVLMIVKDCPEFYYLFWGASLLRGENG